MNLLSWSKSNFFLISFTNSVNVKLLLLSLEPELSRYVIKNNLFNPIRSSWSWFEIETLFLLPVWIDFISNPILFKIKSFENLSGPVQAFKADVKSK